MPATSKRGASKAAASPSSSSSPPLANALLLAGAVGYGLWILVTRGRVSWPPDELLTSAYTLAGCLALVGPVILAKREPGEGGLGELAWMTGGVLVWVYDLLALIRGDLKAHAWATPLKAQVMGLTILAVLLAGWRIRGQARGWSWTNVVGWLLGSYWVGMGLAALWPLRSPGLVLR